MLTLKEKTAAHRPAKARLGLPDLGVGVGLRVPHYTHILAQRPTIDFFEIISENFMGVGGKPAYHLDRFLESYRIVPHGVSLNIGGPDPLDWEYLEQLKKLVRKVKPPWVSDHLCWCGAGGAHLHDLLPLPYTAESMRRVVERARTVQDFLELPIALENTSSYLAYSFSAVDEWTFILEIADRANAGILLDVNNVYVSAYNHGLDPYRFIDKLANERVIQLHLAGHTNLETHIIDTHRGPVIDDVWDLYRHTLTLTGRVSTLIEWDDQIPDFPTLELEVAKAIRIRDEVLSAQQHPAHSVVAPPEALVLAELDSAELAWADPSGPTSELPHLQTWMTELLTQRRALDQNPALAQEIARYIRDNHRLSPAEQLEIYREQVWLRHTHSLLEDFPGLANILEQTHWERVVESYLTAHPPQGFSLRDLGKSLPEHLKQCEWLEHQALCVDMARVEWAYIEAFDAPDTPPLDAGKLQQIPPEAWEKTRLVLSPALRLLDLEYPLAALRKLRKEKSLGSLDFPKPEAKPEAHCYVIYRSAALNRLSERVDRAAFVLLDQLSQGAPLATACEATVDRMPEASERLQVELGAWFQHWGALGWIVDVHQG